VTKHVTGACKRTRCTLRRNLAADAERPALIRMNDPKHWNRIYSSQPADNLGWYKPHLETSLAWIRSLDPGPQEPIIDVGGGASTLVDDLLAKGHKNLTVLDLSESAIQIARKRLGKAAGSVTWLVGDVTEIELPCQYYRLWHDRAVFHFLIDPESQRQYKEKLIGALKPGGNFIIGTFTPEAPPQCSGLPVKRYDSDLLAEFFADKFELKRHQNEMHTTPGGVKQAYVYCLFQRTA